MKSQAHGSLRWLGVLLVALLYAAPALATGKVYYYYTDALHSAVVETDAAGTVLERTYYAPFGSVLNRSLRNGPGYTGHEEDAATGLVYMQQRYYDPQAARFISVDPVQVTANGGNFNRYWYANDNPYRYTDPFGLYTCTGAKVCAAVASYLTQLKNSAENLQQLPRSQRQAARVMAVITEIGDLGKSGPHYVSGEVEGKGAAQTDQAGTTTLDLNKLSGSNSAQQGAIAIGHEAQHDIDSRKNGIAGNTDDRTVAEKEFFKSENNAYKTSNAIISGFGGEMTENDFQKDVNTSVSLDIMQWDKKHPQKPKSSVQL